MAGFHTNLTDRPANLNPLEMTSLLSELKNNFVERKVSSSVMKRLDEGNWESALIMGELARFYWNKTRGTGWSEDVLPTVERIDQAKEGVPKFV